MAVSGCTVHIVLTKINIVWIMCYLCGSWACFEIVRATEMLWGADCSWYCVSVTWSYIYCVWLRSLWAMEDWSVQELSAKCARWSHCQNTSPGASVDTRLSCSKVDTWFSLSPLVLFQLYAIAESHTLAGSYYPWQAGYVFFQCVGLSLSRIIQKVVGEFMWNFWKHGLLFLFRTGSLHPVKNGGTEQVNGRIFRYTFYTVLTDSVFIVWI